MKKQRPKPKQVRTIARDASHNTTGSSQSKEVQPKLPKIQNSILTFAAAWKGFWSYAGPAITIIGLWVYWTPSLSVSSGVNLDPAQNFQTQFVVTNTGHVTVYDVRFICSLIGNRAYIGELDGDARILQPVFALNPGSPVSRGCFSRSLNVNGPMLKVEVHYRWPLIRKDDIAVGYFSVRSSATGFMLVPEAPPNPEPPALITTGG